MKAVNNSTLKRAAFWNTLSGLINAGQSALILIFISRFMGVYEAGLFSIAYAVANLAYTFAMYGVRTFQVTDVKNYFSFCNYFTARCVTIVATMTFMFLYSVKQYSVGNYDVEKVLVVILICIWKMIDAMEDVFYGMYQQHGRLDIGAENYTYRLAVSTTLFCILTILGISLVKVIVVVVLTSALVTFILIRHTFLRFGSELRFRLNKKVLKLIIECFSACVGTTLLVYISNVPKYIIDWHMDTKTQAYFGYLMMPAFVILMFNRFLYVPIIRDLGEVWNRGEIAEFVKKILMQYALTVALTIICCVGGGLFGIPILSLVYGVDLSPFYKEFLVILVAGGMNAMVSFIMVPLTTIRFQGSIAIGFAIASVVSIFLGDIFVSSYGLLGVTVLYLLINILLVVYLTVCLFVKIKLAHSKI